MNQNIRKIFEGIALPDDLHERAEAKITEKRSVKMNKKFPKRAAIVLAALVGAALLCAAAKPVLNSIFGKSAVVQYNGDGKAVAVEQSVFDPASYRPQGVKGMLYLPEAVLGDPEAEIMTVFEDLENLETAPFVFYDGDDEIPDISAYRIPVGGSLKMVCPWTEFVLTRKSENVFTMIDEVGCGFTYNIYPMTGDNDIVLDYAPTGYISEPTGDVKTVENGSGFVIQKDQTVAIGEGTATYKKGDIVRYTLKFKNLPDEAIGEGIYPGFYLNPSDPMGESDGPAYREGDGWFYPQYVRIDGYETVLEFPLKFSGEYRFTLANIFNDCESDLELEYFRVEVNPEN